MAANFEVLKQQFREIVEKSQDGSIPIFIVRKYFGQIMSKNYKFEIEPLLALNGHRMDQTTLLKTTIEHNNIL